MFIKRLMLPSAEREDLALLNGAAIIGMPRNCQNFLPFGVFPPKCLNTVEFGYTTVFHGSLSGIKAMLSKVIEAKLSESFDALYGMSDDTLCEFCKLCELQYKENIGENDFDFEFVTKECLHKYAQKRYALYEENKKWSVLDYFNKFLEGACVVMVESPEDYMSFRELCVFAEFIEGATAHHKCQFIIFTNSPILFGIKNAVLYDLDSNPILPYTWHNSPLVAEYKKYFYTVLELHTYNKKK